MSIVNQTYLKDENGNVISPIVSLESVYDPNSSVSMTNCEYNSYSITDSSTSYFINYNNADSMFVIYRYGCIRYITGAFQVTSYGYSSMTATTMGNDSAYTLYSGLQDIDIPSNKVYKLCCATVGGTYILIVENSNVYMCRHIAKGSSGYSVPSAGAWMSIDGVYVHN